MSARTCSRCTHSSADHRLDDLFRCVEDGCGCFNFRPSSFFSEPPTGIDIAHYFWEETDRRNPGCDGIDLYYEGAEYCYLWVEAMVDHDMWESYLLEVRTKVGEGSFDETRDFLYLHAGTGPTFEVEWHNHPIRFDAPVDEHIDRMHDGLTWFVSRVVGSVEAHSEARP